jgi:hypothetical protein
VRGLDACMDSACGCATRGRGSATNAAIFAGFLHEEKSFAGKCGAGQGRTVVAPGLLLYLTAYFLKPQRGDLLKHGPWWATRSSDPGRAGGPPRRAGRAVPSPMPAGSSRSAIAAAGSIHRPRHASMRTYAPADAARAERVSARNKIGGIAGHPRRGSPGFIAFGDHPAGIVTDSRAP